MVGAPFSTFLRRLRQSLKTTAAGDTADADLLERFVARRDEAAFEALVWRHGSMVLAVCNRVLGDVHAAEDAFQATFLVLVRRAGSISRRPSLGSWLHGVAFRTALKARARAACRRRHEREAMALEAADTTGDLAWRELRPVLDAELDRLPDRYRMPLILCYLEGKTQAEAAEQLGWRLGTLATRVLRGRQLLRSLLARRGLTLTVAGLTAALMQDSASATAPAVLVRATVEHAALTVAGTAALPPSIEFLVTGVMRTMTYTKIRKALLIALAALVLAGAGLVWHQAQADVTAAESIPAPEPAAIPRAAGDKDGAMKDLELLQGVWTVSTMDFGGMSIPKELLTGFKHTFAGNKLTWDGAIGMMSAAGKISTIDGVYKCTFKIDPAKDPKQIDITLHFSKEDKTVLGIYEIKSDTLKLCFSSDGRYPTEFSSKDNHRIGNMVLTRAKKQ